MHTQCFQTIWEAFVPLLFLIVNVLTEGAWSLLRVYLFYLCRCGELAGSVAELLRPAESTLPVWDQSGEPVGCGA